MNEIIERLYEIEEKATQIMEETKQEKLEIMAKNTQAEQNITKEITEEMEGQLTSLKSILDEQVNQKVEEIVFKNQESIRHLEETYEGKYDSFAQEIVKKITEV
ncbi:MAG: hypothetical protein RR139_04460 [Lachnospiraceae bacterium]